MSSAINFDLLIISAAGDSDKARKLRKQFGKYKLPIHLLENSPGGSLSAPTVNNIYISFEQGIDTELGITALKTQRAILVCSPKAVASIEVRQWLKEYIKCHGYKRLLCLIVEGEPNASDKPGFELVEAFPLEVRYRLDESGQLTQQRFKPLAADARPGADGSKLAFIKLVAGVFGVRFAHLHRRVIKRRRQQLVIAMLGLLMLASYMVLLDWQRKEKVKTSLQQVFQTAVTRAFLLANQDLPNQAKDALQHAKSLFQSAKDKDVLNTLNERIRQIRPDSQTLIEGVTFERALSSHDGKIQGGIYQTENDKGRRFYLAVYRQTGILKFPLYGVKSGIWNTGTSHQVEGRILAYSLNTNYFWYIESLPNQFWQLKRLELTTGKVRRFEPQNEQLSRQFSNLAHPIVHEYLYSLNQGWLAYYHKGVLTLKHYDSGEQWQLPESDFIEDNQLSNLWFSPTKIYAFFTVEGTTSLYAWDYRNETVKRLDYEYLSGPIYASDPELKYLITNHTLEQQGEEEKYAILTDADSLTKQRFVNVSLFGAVDAESWIYRGEDHSTNRYALIKLKEGSEEPLWVTRSNRWYYGIGAKDELLFSQLGEGNIVRLDKSSGVPMTIMSTECADSYHLNSDGMVFCLTDDNLWKRYNAASYLSQEAVQIGPFVHNILNQGNHTIVLHNTNSKAKFEKIDWKLRTLDAKYEWSEKCFGNAKKVNNNGWLLAFHKGKFESFTNQCGGVSALNANVFFPEYYYAEYINNKFSTSSLKVLHLQNFALLNAEFERTNIFVNKYEYLWNPRIQSFDWSKGIATDVKLTDNKNIVYRINSPIKSHALLVTKDDQSNNEFQLLEWQSGRANPYEVIKRFTLAKNHSYQLGYTPNGRLYWFSFFNSDDRKIYWYSLDEKLGTDFLPQKFETKYGFIRFSSNGRYMLKTEFSPSFALQVYDMDNGAKLYAGTLKQDIEFHKSMNYVRLGSQVFFMSEEATPVNIEYPEEILLHNLHESKALAAGLCGLKVCVVNLNKGHVVFLARNDTNIKVNRVKFLNQKEITYVLDDQVVVKQKWTQNTRL